MKTKRFANYLKLGVLLFGISILLWNCEKEEFIENQQQDDFLKAKIVLNSKIPSYIDKYIGEKTNESYKAFIGREGIYLLNTNAKTVNEKALGIINRAKAVVVENEKNTKYTFSILPYNYDENVMINLVVVDTGDGNIMEYFIKFQFENIHTMPRIASSGALDMSQFSGEITYYNSDGNEFGNKKATYGRTISKSGSSNPCPGPTGGGLDNTGDDESSEGDNTSGGSDTGGGDTNQGGGSTICTLLYAQCGNKGNADGHADTGGNCGGSPLVGVECKQTYERSARGTGTEPECGGNTGLIVDINVKYTLFLTELDNDLQLYLMLNSKNSNLIEQFLEDNKDSNGNYTAETIIFAREAARVWHETNGKSEIDLDNRLIYNPNLDQDYISGMTDKEKEIFNTLTTIQKSLYLKSAQNAKNYVSLYYEETSKNGNGDAFRHAFWNGLCTARLGEAITKRLTDAHEEHGHGSYTFQIKEKGMDLFNNEKGRFLYINGSGKLYMIIKTALEAGILRKLSNLDNDRRPTSASILIPTD